MIITDEVITHFNWEWWLCNIRDMISPFIKSPWLSAWGSDDMAPVARILISDWLRQVTWPEYWLLIGPWLSLRLLVFHQWVLWSQCYQASIRMRIAALCLMTVIIILWPLIGQYRILSSDWFVYSRWSPWPVCHPRVCLEDSLTSSEASWAALVLPGLLLR